MVPPEVVTWEDLERSDYMRKSDCYVCREPTVEKIAKIEARVDYLVEGNNRLEKKFDGFSIKIDTIITEARAKALIKETVLSLWKRAPKTFKVIMYVLASLGLITCGGVGLATALGLG